MSEGTDTSAQSSEIASPSKPKRKLGLMIAAIVIAALLVGTGLYVLMQSPGPKTHTLDVVITGMPTTIDAGKTATIHVTITLDNDTKSEAVLTDQDSKVDIRWSKTPSGVADFDLLFKDDATITAATSAMTGTISCKVTYTWGTGTNEKVEKTATAPITVNAPFLDSVTITPSSKELQIGANQTFTAQAIDSVGGVMSGGTYSWSVHGMASSDYTLNPTSGSIVKFTGLAAGNATLNCSVTIGAITKTGSAVANVSGHQYPRSVDYRWYDMFNVPFGEWWSRRWTMTHIEQPWTFSYPYIFIWHGSPPGNIYYYSDLRLNVTGKNVTQLNMNENPEFLPYLGTARGGNAVIDWYLQYLTSDQVRARIPSAASWNDGWFVNLKGTVTLDRQAAKAVLGVTDAQFDDFATWWATNNASIGQTWQDWITAQSSGALDIHPMYDYDLNWIDWVFWCQKVGNNIVVHMDSVSWGMEAMMTRWLHDSFMPNEWYFEDLTMHMSIGPERAEVDIDGVVVYGMYIYESTLVYQGTHGDPVWVWESMLQDYVASEPPLHPRSDYDKYMPYTYANTAPGSQWYGKNMTYDYTPGAHNLSENETMTFEWPAGPQTFICQSFDASGNAILGQTYNITSNMTAVYEEPDPTDLPYNMVIDNANRKMTFTGPIDFWDWSKNQTNHTWLKSEWDRLGMLPYGCPYLEWKNESAAKPPQIDHFTVTGVTSPIKGGTSASVTVRAFDQYNNPFTSYDGTVNFTSSDLAASLPANYTFVAGDSGVHTFTNSVVFHTAGSQSVTVKDTVRTTATGSQTGITVQPEPVPSSLVLSGLPVTVTEGQWHSVTVTVRDQYGLVYTGYDKMVNFTSNRSDIRLPANYTFTLADAGVHVFSSEVNFTGLGYYALTCVDTTNAAVNGTLTGIFVVGAPPVITSFVMSGPAEVDVEVPLSITVVAHDQYGRVFDTYNGTVHFTTNATLGQYTLPSDYTFLPGDSGSKTFTGVVFKQAGEYSIGVADIVNVTATGSMTIQVNPRAPEIRYKLYDMFEEPFGQWWWGNSATYKGRIVKYQTDSIVWNETHKHTYLYNPDLLSQHAILMAPYHWSTDARNITWVTVSNPYVMPERYIDIYGQPIPDAPGAVAQVDIRMNYLDEAAWFGKWAPILIAYGNTPVIVNTWLKNQGDGYATGIEYTLRMNRPAALQWVNLSLSESEANIPNWWSANYVDYEFFWRDWVYTQGNTVYDIFSSYEDFFYDYFFASSLAVDGSTGDIVMKIYHAGFGHECLMARWLTAAALNNHEVYWENFTMNATFNTQYSDVRFDATGQYNLHAVKANASSGNNGAWAWDAARLDYVASNYSAIYHPSAYDPYYSLTYTSWAAGDTVGYFGQAAHYDTTPGWFNLTNYMTFTVELPKGSNVPAYLGQAVPVGSVAAAKLKNVANYTALEYNGTASLGYTLPDLRAYYDAGTQTLTMPGPMNFDNPRGVGGLLYHGAPWIEFNVSSTVTTQSVVDVSQPAPTGASVEAVSSGVIAVAMVACGVLLAVAAIGLARRH